MNPIGPGGNRPNVSLRNTEYLLMSFSRLVFSSGKSADADGGGGVTFWMWLSWLFLSPVPYGTRAWRANGSHGSHGAAPHERITRWVSWKTWESPGILKWLFPGLEKSLKKFNPQFWKSPEKVVIFICSFTLSFKKNDALNISRHKLIHNRTLVMWMNPVHWSCAWTLFTGHVDEPCPLVMWMNPVYWSCGWTLFIGHVDEPCSLVMWMNPVHWSPCGWTLGFKGGGRGFRNHWCTM